MPTSLFPVVVGALLGVAAAWAAWAWLRRGTYLREGDEPLLGDPAGRARRDLIVLAAACALAGAASGSVPGWGWLLAGAYLAGGVIVSWTDIDVHRIPDRVTGPWALIVAAASLAVVVLAGEGGLLVGAALGAVAFGALFVVLAVVGSMGLGDVKLAALSGWVLGVFGWPWLLLTALVATLASGLAVAIVLLLVGRSGKTHMPFGPAIVLGTAAAIVLDAAGIV